MTHKRFQRVCGIVAVFGFLLLLGTAGGSDCDTLTLKQIFKYSATGLALFIGGLWMGGYLS